MGHRIHFKRNAECSSENLTARKSHSPWKDDRKPVDHKQIIAYIETGWEIKKVIIIPDYKIKDIESLGYNIHYRYK